MRVCIDEARHDRLARKIEHFRRGAYEFRDVAIVSNHHELSRGDRQSLGPRQVRIDRDYIRMPHDQLGGRGACGRRTGQGNDDSAHAQ